MILLGHGHLVFGNFGVREQVDNLADVLVAIANSQATPAGRNAGIQFAGG